MFKTMTGVLDPKKNPKPEEIQKIPSYIFCQWLAGNPHTILAANQINYYDDIPIECQYQMIKTVFAGKVKYIPYVKGATIDKQKSIEYVSKHFKISEEKAREYVELIDPEELENIKKIYSEYELKKGKS